MRCVLSRYVLSAVNIVYLCLSGGLSIYEWDSNGGLVGISYGLGQGVAMVVVEFK
jgi:hypothetical protein